MLEKYFDELNEIHKRIVKGGEIPSEIIKDAKYKNMVHEISPIRIFHYLCRDNHCY